MTTVQDVYNILNQKYPYSIQEDYDNSGVMADFGRGIDRIIVSLDITNAVVQLAVTEGAQLIVSHHPTIFRPIRSITYNTPLQRLASAGISAISAHTNFDLADGGVNDALAETLELQDVTPVFRTSEQPVNGVMADFGRGIDRIIVSLDITNAVVQLGGGACGEYVFACRAQGIDAFVTGECKHHELIYAKDNGITVVAAGHYATESVALEALAGTLRSALPDVNVKVTRVDDPISFTE